MQSLPNYLPRRVHRSLLLAALVLMLGLNGCAALVIALVAAAVGVAGESALTYSINGVAAQTLTVPLPRVRRAALKALKRMGIRVEGREKTSLGEIIRANSKDRLIEIRLERISRRSTRIQTVARHGFFLYDRATAVEIIQQTEKVLNGRS